MCLTSHGWVTQSKWVQRGPWWDAMRNKRSFLSSAPSLFFPPLGPSHKFLASSLLHCTLTVPGKENNKHLSDYHFSKFPHEKCSRTSLEYKTKRQIWRKCFVFRPRFCLWLWGMRQITLGIPGEEELEIGVVSRDKQAPTECGTFSTARLNLSCSCKYLIYLRKITSKTCTKI